MTGEFTALDQQWRDSYLARLPRAKSITGLAVTIGVLMAAFIALRMALVVRIGDQQDLLHRLQRGVAVGANQAAQADHRVTVLALWLDGLYLAIGVLAVIWLYRARWNTDELSAYEPSRRKGWVFWGWICPIVTLWFPYQIVRDIVRAQRAALTGELVQRRIEWTILIWWLLYLGDNPISFGAISSASTSTTSGQDAISTTLSHSHWEIAGNVASIVAGLAFVAVVAKLTAGDRALSVKPLAAPPRPSWFGAPPTPAAVSPKPTGTAWQGLSFPLAGYPESPVG